MTRHRTRSPGLIAGSNAGHDTQTAPSADTVAPLSILDRDTPNLPPDRETRRATGWSPQPTLLPPRWPNARRDARAAPPPRFGFAQTRRRQPAPAAPNRTVVGRGLRPTLSPTRKPPKTAEAGSASNAIPANTPRANATKRARHGRCTETAPQKESSGLPLQDWDRPESSLNPA